MCRLEYNELIEHYSKLGNVAKVLVVVDEYHLPPGPEGQSQ